MLTLTYEFKLIPDNRQIEVMEHTLNVCRSVWNYALRERKDWLNSRKSPVNACSLVQEYIISADVPYPTYHNQAKFIEDIDFRSWGRGMLSKHCLDAAFGQFVTILKWVAWKRDVFVAEVDKNYTSQICPNYGSHTGKKSLNQREHNCPECGYKTHRDVAAAQVIRNRGREDALGHSVL